MRHHFFWVSWGRKGWGRVQLTFWMRGSGTNPNSSPPFLGDPGGVPPSQASGLHLLTGAMLADP